MDKHQKEYVLREQLGVIREELGENADSEADEYEKKPSELDARLRKGKDEKRDKAL